MRRHCGLVGVFLVFSLAACTGCSGPSVDASRPAADTAAGETVLQPAEDGADAGPPVAARVLQPPTGFGPAKVGILPLTESTAALGGGPGRKLSIYVALLDAFGSQIKAPGTWRFELYEYVPRSAERKGQRVAIWPDMDLTRPAENHKYWRDFLRAYEFHVDMQADPKRPYVLEATCVCPDGRRLSGEYLLRSG